MYYLSFLVWFSCTGDKDSGEQNFAPSAEPSVSPITPTLRRLTVAQYHNIITDVFGEGLLISQNLEPDVVVEGFKSLGAAVSSISPVGVERYEQSSLNLVGQVIAEPERLDSYFDCNLSDISEDCLRTGVGQLGLSLWRRPLIDDEINRFVHLFQSIEVETDDSTALEYTISGLLQSPFFLYRIRNI